MLTGLKHLHDNGICHRDMKPENIMFETNNFAKDPMVKIIDFGLAQYFHSDSQVMKTRTGTPYYVAPEILQGAYTQSCDMWALGVITYCMLSGYPPFNAEDNKTLFRKILHCDYEFHEPQWTHISSEAKKFISCLIEPDTKKRLKPG